MGMEIKGWVVPGIWTPIYKGWCAETPVKCPKAKDWTVIPILNKERTDIKEIVIAVPVNPNNIIGPLMDVARWRQNGGDWKLEGNIGSKRENDSAKNYTNHPILR